MVIKSLYLQEIPVFLLLHSVRAHTKNICFLESSFRPNFHISIFVSVLCTHGLMSHYLSSFYQEFSVFVLLKVQTKKGIITGSQSAFFPSEVLPTTRSIKTSGLVVNNIPRRGCYPVYVVWL